MARKKAASSEPLDLSALFRSVGEELTRVARIPDANLYKPHAKQEVFHSCENYGRLFLGGNRCLAEGTEVLMADGSAKPIENIVVGDYVIAQDGSKTKVIAVWDNGERKVNAYKIGRYQDIVEVVCTPDHKFYAARESHGILGKFTKRPIGSLVDSRGRHKIMRSQGTRFGYREPRAGVLGLMLGDGHFGGRPSQLQFTCADPELIEDFYPLFFQHPAEEAKGGIQYRLNDAQYWHHWFSALGLGNTRSHNKFIPAVVWEWDEVSIAELCAALLATDGSFYKSDRSEYHVGFSSNSLALITEFRRLMGIRLGIWGSTITYESRGTYQITYGTHEALSKISRLPIPGSKRYKTGFEYERMSYSSYAGVKSVTPMGIKRTYDITVEHESHAFILANGLITSNSGKSVAGVMEDIWWLTGTHPFLDTPEPPVRGRAVAVDFTFGVDQILIPLFKQWLPKRYLLNGSWDESYRKDAHELTLSNGSTLEFMSYDQDTDKFAGTSRHFIHFDEEPPQHIFNENMLRLLDTNGRYWITMTPVEGMTWLYDELYLPTIEGTKKDLTVIQVNNSENPYLPADARERILGNLDKDERAAREEGKFIEIGGRVFKAFTEETHVIPSVDIQRFKDWRIYVSIDSGWNNPTAVLWHAVSPDDVVITFSEHYQSEMTVEDHAKEILAREAKWSIEPWIRTGDPAMRQTKEQTGTSVQMEYAKHGIYLALDGVPTGPGSVAVGVARMQQYLKLRSNGKPRWFITEDCPNLIREMKRLRWATYESKKTAQNNNPQEKIHKKDDHATDSARYFFTLLPDLAPEDESKEEIEVALGKGILRYDEALIAMHKRDDVEFVGEAGTTWKFIDNYY